MCKFKEKKRESLHSCTTTHSHNDDNVDKKNNVPIDYNNVKILWKN